MRKRNNKIEFYLNDKEFKRLEKQAGKSKLSRSELLRSLIMNCSAKEPPPLDYPVLIERLKIIGRNINQITIRVNATGYFLKEEYEKNVKLYFEILYSIQEIVNAPEKKCE